MKRKKRQKPHSEIAYCAIHRGSMRDDTEPCFLLFSVSGGRDWSREHYEQYKKKFPNTKIVKVRITEAK